MNLFLRILIGLAVVLAFIQILPFGALDNPPVETEMPASDEVRAVMERSCYDCHSNEARWPWYAHVAPVSWLIAHDVEEGREHVNFSTWNRYDEEEREEIREESLEEAEEGKMPLPIYLTMHPDARLSEADIAVLRQWAEAPR